LKTECIGNWGSELARYLENFSFWLIDRKNYLSIDSYFRHLA